MRWCWLSCVVLLWLGGCLFVSTSYSVIDAETGKPIAHATIRTFYDGVVHPQQREAVTDELGRGRLTVQWPDEPAVIASAPGYFSACIPLKRDGCEDRHRLALFAEPEANVRLILPTGYTGLVEVLPPSLWVYTPDVPPDFPIGQRVFDVRASPPALVALRAPAFGLESGSPRVVAAMYEDGTTLPVADGTAADDDGDKTKIALRLLTNWSDPVLVVGTFDQARDIAFARQEPRNRKFGDLVPHQYRKIYRLPPERQ